jgi:hypothetical protein
LAVLSETAKLASVSAGFSLGGSMAATLIAALPWYHRNEYPALLKLFSDPDEQGATYDLWLAHAEAIESQLRGAGFSVARIWIRAVPFAAWCKVRNVSPDQRARVTFATEAARELRGARVYRE